MTRSRNLHSPARQGGTTLLELVLVMAILGLLANVIVPALIMQIAKGRAAALISEFKLIENAVHNHHTDSGAAPGPWFSAAEHPDLAPYLRGRINYQQPGLGLTKIFLRYPESYPSRFLRFRSGYLLWSQEPSPLLTIVERTFDGQVEVFWPGRLVVLVIES